MALRPLFRSIRRVRQSRKHSCSLKIGELREKGRGGLENVGPEVHLHCLVTLKKFVLAGASTQQESARQGKVFMRQLSFNQIKSFMFFLEGSRLDVAMLLCNHSIGAFFTSLQPDPRWHLFNLKRTGLNGSIQPCWPYCRSAASCPVSQTSVWYWWSMGETFSGLELLGCFSCNTVNVYKIRNKTAGHICLGQAFRCGCGPQIAVLQLWRTIRQKNIWTLKIIAVWVQTPHDYNNHILCTWRVNSHLQPHFVVWQAPPTFKSCKTFTVLWLDLARKLYKNVSSLEDQVWFKSSFFCILSDMNTGFFSLHVKLKCFPFNISAASVDVVATDVDMRREQPTGSAWDNTAERDVNHMLSASATFVSDFQPGFMQRKVSALLTRLGDK